MQQTANYNLNLPEGTDVVNPLVDYNPNFSTIDSAMKANADRTVGRATCIKSGTTHVVTRANTGSNIINFTATGDWNAGDTMTIDSTIVSVFLPDGSAALDGAYLINSEVFGILNGTRFTLYSNITELTAASTSYDNTGSGLTATDVQNAIDEINNNVNNLTHNKVTSTVDMSETVYTFPNDGYVVIENVGNTSGIVIGGKLRDSAGNIITPIKLKCTIGDEVVSIYVKKGLKFALDASLPSNTVSYVRILG